VMLYSIGKDSSVMLRLAQKAFHPIKPPFPLLHVDTSYKFQEMIEFRDRIAEEVGMRLIVHSATRALEEGANPFRLGTQKCCAQLKTGALLEALSQGGFDAAIGGARRDEEKSRAKERVYSFRDNLGQWDPKNQRPELWNIYNGRINKGESIRVFPLSNWTELDVWEYIKAEDIPIVPLYFARNRPMLVRGDSLISPEHNPPTAAGEAPVEVMSRMRSLGCTYCTGGVRSTATSITEIIDELRLAKKSERENRIIDHDQEGSMEQKKREGYF
jgi:sulfate adenylyltransferase subunit 2